MDALLSTLTLRIFLARRSELGPEWRSSVPDPLPCNRLYYIESGAAHLDFPDSHLELRPGHLYLIPARTPMAYFCPRHVIISWTHFDARVLGGVLLFDHIPVPRETQPPDCASIRERFARLIVSREEDTPASLLEAQGLLLQILAPFFASMQSTLPINRDLVRFRDLLEMIDRRLDQPLRVTELARIAHLEPTYFCRLFTRALGIPPSRYILQRRIERAQMLLLQTDLPIRAIAARLGFSDPFHLSRTFKKMIGTAPSDFRRRTRRPGP
ncbi:helix-turn-helix transcriptional regulator [bacterium]|nr:helix-turn-helix transcriptional regulator [bacterium]